MIGWLSPRLELSAKNLYRHRGKNNNTCFGNCQFHTDAAIQYCAVHSSNEISQLEYPEPLFYQELISLSNWWPSSSTLESVIFWFTGTIATRKSKACTQKNGPKSPQNKRNSPTEWGGGAPLINDRRCCITHYTPELGMHDW